MRAGGFFYGENMDKQIGYSFLEVKAVDEEKRIIRGIATTPEPDRVDDIVEPMGAKFKNPAPLLWMHRHDLPVGSVVFGKPTKEGIPFEASLPRVSEPSGLKSRIDEAWESVKAGLVRAVSIGFRPLEYSIIAETGGKRFTKSEIFELSLVTVPANASATISEIKSLDRQYREAAIGQETKETKSVPDSGVAEKKAKPVKLPTKEKEMSLSEKLKGFQDELKAKNGKLIELAEKSGEDGQTFDEADQEQFDTLNAEVKTLSDHIKRLEIAQKASMESAKAVPGDIKGAEQAAQVRSGVQVKSVEKLDPGIEFTRYAMCKLAAKGNPDMAVRLAKTHYGNHERVIKTLEFQAGGGRLDSVMKLNVEAGTTLDATWAAPLVDYNNFAGDFVEYLRPRTIIGQFGNGSIPSLNRIPFNVRIAGQTTGGNAYWVGEGAPKPLTPFDFTATELRWAKVAAISVLTEELIRFSNPSAERLVRDALAAAVIERLDIDFVDPDKAAVTNVSPASITNGVTPIGSTGNDADAIRCDIQALWAPFIAANNPPRTAVYIMDSITALALSMMQNPLGQSEFPGLTMNGGTLGGVPVIVSDYLPVDSSGHIVILANARDIWLADDGQVTIDASDQASLQMLDNPTNNSATATATSMVSMFQTNSVAFRAERYINWAKRRTTGVQYLNNVNWGDCNS